MIYLTELKWPEGLLSVHVPEQVGLDGMGTRDGELERVDYLAHDLLAHGIPLCRREQAGTGQVLETHLDGIEGIPRAALRHGAVAALGVVAGAAMRTEPVARRFDERRTATAARPRDRLPGRLVDRDHVHAVNLHRRQTVSAGPVREVAHRLSRPQRRLHRIEIVLAEK